ncbi:hypothetical protein L9W92_13740 [Pelotomaculum terephthalicicum JT]|uniref:sulfurtransferase n=1 Tax=Pelotomaculum TaxID=191373 RepID=UPI0009CB92A3|nr:MULTISPECIES: rhodanese-like domain-containing protein [Pelotomaculum]MCG9969096.1 hypothetical protein [Pelotomaculum terephthalicicum JT]OPX86104.1 MAG: Thiosulfate sulfurtransferase [Pelotomaculum sp. PtaB.Bin117]OPY60147.1 MAG: Thiosulfate sulfurtransferase [Pelotomaculum sp. PtaU1.Bin065]
MNKKRRFFLIYFLIAFFVFLTTFVLIAGYKRSSTIVQPTYQNINLTDEEKIAEYSNPDAVITASELNNILNDPNLIILDARAANNKDYVQNCQGGHIPGASVLLRSHYTDTARWFRVAPAKQIQKYLSEMGIDNHSRIVIYGNDSCLQGRVYWMFKLHGCDNQIQILDGGIDKWQEEGYQLSSERTSHRPSKFAFNPDKADQGYTTDLKEMGEISSSNSPDNIIVDVRPNNEYLNGHIPSSVNVSVDELMNEDKTFKPLDELVSIFTAKGITPDKNVYVYCTTGSLSSLAWYVLHELMGYPSVINYDGGLKEWSSRERLLEKGERSY